MPTPAAEARHPDEHAAEVAALRELLTKERAKLQAERRKGAAQLAAVHAG
eukprot:SAG22_NODE_1902_length_3339_cov_2.045370_6_plen_50_part_00